MCSYVGVGENEDVQLFYYFLPSESNPKEDPLMLWLTGGPGCSSISGILYEMGMFISLLLRWKTKILGSVAEKSVKIKALEVY